MDVKTIKKHLEILGIPYGVDFTEEDIKSSYRLRSKFFHPDMKKVHDADEQFKKIKNAEEYLLGNFTFVKDFIRKNKSSFVNSIGSTSGPNQKYSSQDEYDRKIKEEYVKRKRAEEQEKKRQEELRRQHADQIKKRREAEECLRQEQEARRQEEIQIRKEKIQQTINAFKTLMIDNKKKIIIGITAILFILISATVINIGIQNEWVTNSITVHSDEFSVDKNVVFYVNEEIELSDLVQVEEGYEYLFYDNENLDSTPIEFPFRISQNTSLYMVKTICKLELRISTNLDLDSYSMDVEYGDTISTNFIHNSLSEYLAENHLDINGYEMISIHANEIAFSEFAITENVDIEVNFNPKDYTLNFYLNQTELYDSLVTQYSDSINYIDNVHLDGYEFIEWLDSNGDVYDISNMPSTDVNLYARFEPISYVISYDYLANNHSVEYDEVIQLPTPEREGYTFVSWKYNGLSIDQEFIYQYLNDISLEAEWSINSYTVTFNTSGGSAIDSITQEYATILSEPADPTREGYAFLGWVYNNEPFVFGTIPGENVEIYADWEPLSFTISFDVLIDELNYDFDDYFVGLPFPEQEGYTFNGWYVNGDLIDESTIWKYTEDIEAIADFSINQYTMTFNSDGGSFVTSIEQDFDSEVSQPADPNRTGYTFLGWYLNDSLYTFGTMPSNDIELIAKWQGNQYTITFIGASTTLDVTFGEQIGSIPILQKTSTGSEISGWIWNSSPDIFIDEYYVWDIDEDIVVLPLFGSTESNSFSISHLLEPSHVIIPTYATMGEYAIYNKDNIYSIFIPSTVIFTHHPVLATYPMEACDNLVIYTDAPNSTAFTDHWNNMNVFEKYTTHYNVTDYDFYGYSVIWRNADE